MAKAVLFDLDGTLFDTSHDLHAAVNALMHAEGKPPVPYDELRDQVSHGSKKILTMAFGLDDTQAPQLERLLVKFLKHYEQTQFADSKPFDGIEALLAQVEELGLIWGIVTNRRTAFTEPLLRTRGYFARSKCVVCADTLNIAKPAPEPMWHACKLLGVEAQQCLFIGDAVTDIQAGKAAGMKTMAAGFGYIPRHEDVAAWQADYIAHGVTDILPQIKQWMAV